MELINSRWQRLLLPKEVELSDVDIKSAFGLNRVGRLFLRYFAALRTEHNELFCESVSFAEVADILLQVVASLRVLHIVHALQNLTE